MKARKLISVWLSVLIAFTMSPTFALFTVSATEPTEVTVYVSNEGNDSTGDGTQANPYATISKAETVLEGNSSADTGIIVMLTNMTFTSAVHTKMITIKGATGTENLNQTGAVISVNGPTTFKDFNVNDTFNHASNGNEVIYENVSSTGSKGTYYFGNLNSDISTPNNIILNGLGQSINNGANVRIGPHQSGGNPSTNATNGTVNSDINIVMNGGYYNQFWMLNGTYNGNLNVTLNNGVMYNGCQFDFYGVNKSTYNGAFQLILNNGFSASNVYYQEVHKIDAANGSWFMYGDNSGGMLSTTATPGTFAVSEGFGAVATNTSTGIEYKSVDGVLTVPAGIYNVTFDSATVYVSNSGNDSTGDGTYENPYGTISKAEAVIEESSVPTGEIIMLTDMYFTSSVHTKMITITGATGAEVLSRSWTPSVSVNGPTTFKHFTMNNTLHHTTNGNVVVYEDIAFSSTWGNFYFGNSDETVTTDNDITITGLGSGVNYGANVQIGPDVRGSGKVINSNINIVVNSGYFNQMDVREATYNGNVSITFNGGTMYNKSYPLLDYWTSYPTIYNGAYQLILNNGFSTSKVSDASRSVSAANGSWFMYGDNSGGMLSTTATPGIFNYTGAKYLKAVDDNNSAIVRYSRNGILDFSASPGTYNITYFDILKKGDLNEDDEIDILDLVAAEIALDSEDPYDIVYDIDENDLFESDDLLLIAKHILDIQTIVWEDI